MTGLLVRLAAWAALVAFLWSLFRYAMSLRAAKLQREADASREQAAGRTLVAEIPLDSGEVVLFVEDDPNFRWSAETIVKAALYGARATLNGGVMAECVLSGRSLPPPTVPEEYEGRERWEVEAFLDAGVSHTIPCGTLREGVSREIALRVFAALKRAIEERGAAAGRAET